MKLVPLLLALALSACDRSPVEVPNASADDAPTRPAPAQPAQVSFKAADGVTLHGNFYPAQDPRALILLFHQAGANRAEYAEIAPRLAAEGYSALAIDQRSGGTMFGSSNQTVVEQGRSVPFEAAQADLEAAVAWAKGQKLPVIVWGSSYSAALAILVAADHPELNGALAFSPGEYLADKGAVHRAAERVTVPLFVTAAREPAEIEDARTIFAAVPGEAKTLYLPTVGGAHGSVALTATANPDGASATWEAVDAFLRRITGGTVAAPAR